MRLLQCLVSLPVHIWQQATVSSYATTETFHGSAIVDFLTSRTVYLELPSPLKLQIPSPVPGVLVKILKPRWALMTYLQVWIKNKTPSSPDLTSTSKRSNTEKKKKKPLRTKLRGMQINCNGLQWANFRLPLPSTIRTSYLDANRNWMIAYPYTQVFLTTMKSTEMTEMHLAVRCLLLLKWTVHPLHDLSLIAQLKWFCEKWNTVGR